MILSEETEILEGFPLRKFLSKDDIKNAVSRLARQISADYAGKNPVAVCVLNGAYPFFEDLLARVTVIVERQFLRVSSYRDGVRPGQLELVRDIECQVKGKDVIIVEDIIDTSQTAKFILRHMESKNPGSVRICALIDKRERTAKGLSPHYTGFKVDAGFLVGYGMDYMQSGRLLEDVYLLQK
ncbi:MAG: hypoxanthine phosphoribosyltransferase [Candidatus Dadabacteria bacterium]|nr:hypoxanthine phosphoribosyltransferase [Candidatus Dadabacteria bacterium]